jgi:hypothetical protein
MSESKEVVNWEDRLAQDAKDIAKHERPALSRISLRSGILSYQDQPYKDNQMEAVIIAHIHERAYYEQDFDPDVQYPPTCYAQSTDGVNMVPHGDIVEPQNASCDGCWADKFGSAKRGKGKACGQRRKLALMPALDNPAEYANAELALLSIPVTSVKNFGTYVNVLASAHLRAPWGMITKIYVKPHPKFQFQVFFEPISKLPDEALSHIAGKIDMALTTLCQPYDLTPPEEREEAKEDNKKKKY